MTTAVASRSAYPEPIAELLPKARALTTKLGELPSRNRLMRELHIGGKKAGRRACRARRRDQARSPGSGLTCRTGAGHRLATAPRGLGREAAGSRTRKPRSQTRHQPPRIEHGGRADQPSRAAFLAGVPARLPAFVAVWSGWVGLGELTGFGIVHPLPGIWDAAKLNTAITLPVGVETYAAYAIRVWLSPAVTVRARRFAKWSTIAALLLGAGGQIAYHLMSAWHMPTAPWPVTTVVASLPVVVVFAGSALAHLVHTDRKDAKR